ncbi:MAG: hypothetical protein JSV91_00155 [Phycisphaerales bacterium]|nr:MAG: hypothetical protein JSV91_00155 [Phycisphaerales bacterium]
MYAISVWGEAAAPFIASCTFIGNDWFAVDCYGGNPTIIGCVMVDNGGIYGGGGISIQSGSATITNCTIVENFADTSGGGIISVGSEVRVANCIVRNNTPAEISDDGAIVTYSNVMGGNDGVGNIDADPVFADPHGRDFRLMPGSPCIDAGFNNTLPRDRNDLDGDGLACERFPVDLDGNPRFADDAATADTGCGLPVVVDMGAYECAGATSDVIYADVDGSGAVDILDLFAVLDNWGPCEGCCIGDVHLDGVVRIDDVFAVLSAWGPCP